MKLSDCIPGRSVLIACGTGKHLQATIGSVAGQQVTVRACDGREFVVHANRVRKLAK